MGVGWSHLRAVLVGLAATVALGLALLPGSALAGQVVPHVATPQEVTPHVVTPQPATDPVDSPPVPSLAPSSATPEEVPDRVAGPVADSPTKPPPEAPPPPLHKPSCPAKGCPYDPSFPIAHFEAYSSDTDWGAMCAGMRFLILWVFGDTIEQLESDPNGYAHPMRAVKGNMEQDTYSALVKMAGHWNESCLTWVNP